jgi:serine/threonine-protein kinase
LTGSHPAGLGSGSTAEVVRAILEKEPLAASNVVSSVDINLVGKRGTTSDSLRRQLRGDLDTILIKALKKDPAERYTSVPA